MAETNPVAFAQQSTVTFDFEFALDSANGSPTGITALNGKIWVADPFRDKVFVYNTDGTRNSSSDFGLVSGNLNTNGMTALNNKFWVVDASSSPKKVYAYNAGGTQDSSSNFNLISDIINPRGITAHDGKLLIVDGTRNKVYGYYANGDRDANSDVGLDGDNRDPRGITSLHGKLWVVDREDKKVYAYDQAGRTLDATLNFDLLGENANADGITSLHGKLWVSDSTTNKVYVYDVPVPLAFDFDLGPSTTSIKLDGITSLNSKFWVVDGGSKKVYAYNADGTPDTDSTIILDLDQKKPFGIAALNNKFWIVDKPNAKVYVYNADRSTRDATLDLTLDMANTFPNGITAYNNQLYVVDFDGNKVYAYNTDNTRDAASDFLLDIANSHPRGITTLNGKFYVTDVDDDIVYAYNTDGTPDAASNFNLHSENDGSGGITSLHGKLWVVDKIDKIVYAYHSDGTHDVNPNVDLDAENGDQEGITTKDGKLFVVDTDSNKVFAYNAANGFRDASSDFGLNADNASPTGITFQDSKFWIVNDDDDKVFVYNADGTRPSTPLDFGLNADNASPTGITAYDNKLWIVNDDDNKVYVYNADGTRPSTPLDFILNADNTSPTGITALHGKLWVADILNSKVYVYNSDGTYHLSLDFDLHTENGSPGGITTLSGKMWVVDSSDDIIYSYNAPAPSDSILTMPATWAGNIGATLNDDGTTDVFVTFTGTSAFDADSAYIAKLFIIQGFTTIAYYDIQEITGLTPTFSVAHSDISLDYEEGILLTIETHSSENPALDNRRVIITKNKDYAMTNFPPDNTSPTLTAVSIASNNSDPTRAILDDIVTLSFTASENIEIPTVTIGGVAADAVAGSGDTWSATKTITAGDNDGAVAFTIDFSDLATTPNTGTQVIATKDGSSVTVDQTAPSLTAVSIESNNSNDPTRATAGDTITLSFTSSEAILPPTVTFDGVAASVTVTGSNNSWNAETTIASTDSEGVVTFSISFFDLASNDGGIATSPTTSNPDVTVDNTAPELDTVSIVSDNTDTSTATTDDIITLSFTSSEPIQTPTVTFGGVTVATVAGSDNTWSATKTITAADVDGSAVTFAIAFSDLATNVGTPVTSITTGSAVTVYQTAPDTTDPELNTVSIASNNSESASLATLDDTITLTFIASEPIGTPDVTINGDIAAAASESGNTWSATKIITSGDADGPVIFTIDYTDLAANDGTQVTSITTGSAVTVDQTAPELNTVSIVSNNSNDPTRATAGNTITLSFTSSEAILPPTVTFDGVAASVTVTGSNNSWNAETTIASTDSEGVVTFSISFFDLAANDGGIATSPTAGNSDVTVDNTAPELDTVSIVSDNTDTSTATTDDIVTLSFTSSEPIQTPTVTFGGVAAVAVAGSDNTWSATKTITAADVDGSAVTFAIDFTDLATNDGIPIIDPTDGTSVTVYQTDPDTTAPTLTVVSIESDNSNDTSRATTGNTITLSFTSSEPIGTPDVTIHGGAATVTGSNIIWSATKTVASTDDDGVVAFTIDFSDLATTPNTGTQVIATKDGTGVTVDNTAPRLDTVTIESSNADQFLATKDDTITLRFTASEDIVTPVVTINGHTADTVTGVDSMNWVATRTIIPVDDADGIVTFTIAFTDLATNVGTTVTAVTEGVATITVDQTVPTLHTISMTSNNSDDDTLATAGNTVTLNFESSEDIKTPVVTINQVPVTPVAVGDSTVWSATRTITSSDADDGIVDFTINYSDLASNAGVEVTGITVGSDVTVDNTAPTLTAVSIESSNADQFLATAGNVVTLRFTASEPILQPTVTINGGTVSLAALGNDNITWSATKTITSTDDDGLVTFRITFTDLAANDGIAVTSPTAGNPGVTVDNTAPTLTAVSIESNNSNDTTLATDGNIITLSFTASENIETPTVTISGDGASVTVTGSGVSWSATKTVASTDDDGAVAFSISYSDLAANDGGIVTSPTAGNPGVTVDNTDPELTAVSIASNNTNDTTLATAGNTVTLSFTSSEPILQPAVTINGDSSDDSSNVTLTAIVGDGTTWSATRDITSADSSAPVTFGVHSFY